MKSLKNFPMYLLIIFFIFYSQNQSDLLWTRKWDDFLSKLNDKMSTLKYVGLLPDIILPAWLSPEYVHICICTYFLTPAMGTIPLYYPSSNLHKNVQMLKTFLLVQAPWFKVFFLEFGPSVTRYA
jgi:hypothetical protein